MISIVFCFGSSIDVAGAKTSFSAFCIGSDIGVGYTATKKIGNAVKRNKAKRIMRELAKKILIKGKTNTYYVLIAKTSILDIKFKDLLEELENIINVK